MAQRQLAAIMFTDLVGYSALTQRNEAVALELLQKHWELLRPVFAKFDGREIKTIGDAFLIEFPSALQAVRSGIAMQEVLVDYNHTVDADRSIQVRIGIHSGDVERLEDDVFGDGVNIASRIEPLAPSGGICISEPVYDSVHNKVDVPFYPLGVQKLKNISQPVSVYSTHQSRKTTIPKSNRRAVFIGTAVTTVILVVILIYNVQIEKKYSPRLTSTSDKKTETIIEASVETGNKSIAILPFTNRSKSEDDAFFTDGLHDDLLTHLSKITDMKVISRTSVMGYRDTQKNMKTIGAELGVATLLEGSVQRAQNQIRINVQLIDVNTDEHLWAEIYDRELTAANIFAIQSEIATAIANALQATLSPEEQARIAAVPTENLVAYDAYLLGKQEMASRTTKKLAEAIIHFQLAIAIDSNFALAYVGLADSYLLQTNYSGVPINTAIPNAETAIMKAMEINDQLSEAYASLGFLNEIKEDNKSAEEAYKKAIELNPNNATAYHWYASILGEDGRIDEELSMIQKALSLDPLSPVINAHNAMLLGEQGKYEESLAQFQKLIEFFPMSPQGYEGTSRLYRSVFGQLDEALIRRKKLASLDPNRFYTSGDIGLIYLDLGDDVRAECWFGKVMKIAPDNAFSYVLMAALNDYRGNDNEKLTYAQQALKLDSEDKHAHHILITDDIKNARYESARGKYMELHPELFSTPYPQLEKSQIDDAIELAYVLKNVNELERANWLLKKAQESISKMPRLTRDGYYINDVRIYTLRGEIERALSALRDAIDEGWRIGWWQYIELDPVLDSIRNEPEFQAMVVEFKADMAEQLTRVKALEKEQDVCVNS